MHCEMAEREWHRYAVNARDSGRRQKLYDNGNHKLLCACIHRIHCVTQPLKCRCCSSSKDSPRFMPRDSPSEQTTRKAGREGISGRPAPILADYNLILSGRESCRCVMLLQNTQRVISPLTDGLGDECRNKDFRRKARTFFFHEWQGWPWKMRAWDCVCVYCICVRLCISICEYVKTTMNGYYN